MQPTGVFSFVLEGEAVTPSSINDYVQRLQEDAKNTGKEREVKKAKATADVLKALSTLASDPAEILDRRLMMECLRDAWLGVKAGSVSELMENSEPDSDSDDQEGRIKEEDDGGEDEEIQRAYDKLQADRLAEGQGKACFLLNLFFPLLILRLFT